MKKKFSRVIAHHLPQCLLLFSILTSNVLFPATVIAQEIENTNNVTQEETVPIDTSEDILEEGISTSIYEEEEVVEPLFVFENGIYTVNTVVEGEEYVYPDNNDVRVKFTEVTQEGNLVIKRVELTEEQKELLNTKDNYGWDISSSMSNGTFKYTLTLPNIYDNTNVEVKYTEDGNEYESIDNSNVEIKSNVVTIEGLDHFTVFVVVENIPTGITEGVTEVDSACSVESVGSDTFCYDTIQDAVGHATGGETINLLSDFTITQQITINKSLTLNGNNHTIFSNIRNTVSNNSAIGISADSVTINNLTIDGSNKYLHGINVYEATNVVLNNVTLKNNKKAGLVVNGSNVKVNNIKTSNNGSFLYGWYAINVDQGVGVSEPAILTVLGTSSHNESYPIYVDNINKYVEVIPNNQYYYYDYYNIFSQTYSRVYLLDKTSPSVPELVSPIDGISINDNTPLMQWKDSTDFGTGVSGYYLKIYSNCTNFNDVSTCQAVYSYTTGELSEYQVEDTLPENTYLWQMKAVDKAGNESNWSNLGKFIIDTSPVFSLSGIKYTYLENGVSKTVVQDRYITNWNTPIFVGKLTSTDIASVKVLINGTEYPAAINDNDMTWEATISSLLVDGSYNVEIIATDSAGKTTIIKKELIIDTVAPTAQYTYYKDGTAITGPAYVQRVDQLSFKAEYFDETPSSGILQDSYVIFDSNAEGTARTGTAYCGWRNPNNTLTITTNPLEDLVPFTNCKPTLTDGKYYMYHQVYDNATRKDIPYITQYGDVKGLYFIVDTQNPNGSIDGIQDSVNFFTKDTTPVLFGTYSDNYGVSNITVKINEEIITPTYSEGNWVSSEFQTLTDGNYTATLTITDFAGNTITESKNITIDTTAPSVSNINITKNGNPVTYVKKGDEITISATITDNLSGINAVTADFSYDNTYNNRPGPIHTPMTPKSGEVNIYETTFTIPDTWNEGDLYITVAALDNARNYNGNRGSAKRLTIDNTPPSAPILTGSPVQYVKWGNVTRTWSPSSSPDVDYYIYENITNGWTSGPYDTGSSEYSITHNTGNYDRIFEWKVYAVDYAGNETWSAETHKVVVDGTKPTVNIENVRIIDKKLTFTVSGTDNLSGARTVGANIYNANNNGSAVIPIGRLAHNIDPQTLNVSYDAPDTDLSGLESGVYTIRASIRDYSGNIEYTTHQIVVDNTAPTTVLNDDLSGKYTNQPILIKGVSTDNQSGIDYVTLSYRLTNSGNDWTVIDTDQELVSTNKGLSFDWNYTWTPPQDGTYDIKASATDVVGNSENSPTINSVTYDTTKPNITLLQIITGILSISAEDNLSGYEEIKFKIDNREWQTYSSKVNLLEILGNQSGTYTIYVMVIDKAGNETTGQAQLVVLPPVTNGEVAGVTDTQNNENNDTKTYYIYATNENEGTDAGEEILETTSIIEEPSVLGERCENKKKVSGYVYIDKNKDKEMNNNEKGIKDITLTIKYTDDQGNTKTEEEVSTDEKGYWETQLCSGKYNIVVKEDTLPKNIEVSEVLSLTVSDNEEETIFNIQALDTRNFWQKYWYLIVGGLAIIVIGYISIKNRKKEEI